MMAGYAVISIGELLGLESVQEKRDTTSQIRGGRSRYMRKKLRR